jgi:hypothetical protein
MHRFFSLSRIVVVVALLCTAALAAPLPAASAADWEATGSYLATDTKGNVFSGDISGTSSLGGSFTGVFSHKANGHRIVGEATLDYGGGDTLTIRYVATINNRSDIYLGTYAVTSGTGTLADAAGFGEFVAEQGSEGNFLLSGLLDL